jgi:hypothetical protein
MFVRTLTSGVQPGDDGQMRRYLTAKDVAAIRRKSEPALVAERKRGIGPPYIRDNGKILYPEDELYEWLEARLVKTDLDA